MTAALIYIHGFLSSAQSLKAQQLKTYVERHYPDIVVHTPSLPDTPQAALQELDALVQRALHEPFCRLGMVGSSLGGFFATVLAERYRLPAVLINPAVQPAELVAEHFLGEHINPYTGQRFLIGEDEIAALRDMQPQRPLHGRYWLLTQEGDETLDYRRGVAFYEGQKQTVEPDGDHSFQDFDRYLSAVVEFLGLSSPQ
jgi:uncharacterized protein